MKAEEIKALRKSLDNEANKAVPSRLAVKALEQMREKAAK